MPTLSTHRCSENGIWKLPCSSAGHSKISIGGLWYITGHERHNDCSWSAPGTKWIHKEQLREPQLQNATRQEDYYFNTWKITVVWNEGKNRMWICCLFGNVWGIFWCDGLQDLLSLLFLYLTISYASLNSLQFTLHTILAHTWMYF